MKTAKILHLLTLALIIGTASYSCKKKGCTDPTADNYDFEAEKDDGSCIYGSGSGNVYTLGNVTTNTTLTATNIQVCSDIEVSAGLTIPAGATITMCAGAKITVQPGGYLTANGTATDPIVFRGQTQTAGFWEGIGILSNNPNNIFNYVTVKDAGTYWYWEYAGVYVGDNAKLSITNSTISNHQNTGLYFHDNALVGNFADNTFADCVTGLSLPSKLVGSIDGNSNYNYNNTCTNNFIEARYSTIGVNTTWPKTNTPILNQGTMVNAGLTISPGSVILNAQDKGFDIEGGSAYFYCVGTATEPITIKGQYSSPGYWRGIEFFESNNPNNQIKYTSIEDGGSYWYHEYSGIILHGIGGNISRLDLDYSSVNNSNNYGIWVKSGSQLFTGGAVQTTIAGVETTNSFSSNGTGSNANCTNGCKVFWQ